MKAEIYMRSGNVIYLRRLSKLRTQRNKITGEIAKISYTFKRRDELHTIEPDQIEGIVVRHPWWDR